MFKRRPPSDVNLYLHTIAHELRNPLVSIEGFASLLSEKYSEFLPSEGKHYLERISKNTSRLQSLLADITQLAKIIIDEKNFARISANDVIQAALDSHYIQLNERQLELRIQPNLPEVYCDSNAMILAFSNLIGNAIKYSREKPDGLIEIGYLDDELFHKFYVKDNGVGFPARDSSKVFLLFSRLRNKKDVSGSGLGLTIVKEIVEGHGGQIWAASRRNRGSTFYFTLPKIFSN